MKSKRLILIILERYKLDNLVPMICSILLYCVVFVRNPIFWRPNWDEKSQLERPCHESFLKDPAKAMLV